MMQGNIGLNPLNSGRKMKAKEKYATISPNKQPEFSSPGSQMKNNRFQPPANKAQGNIIRTVKPNKRVGLQSAKVTTNLNNNQLLFLGANSPKLKNGLPSSNVLAPIVGSTKNDQNSHVTILKKQFSEKNPFNESVSTSATGLNSNQLNERIISAGK